MRGLLLFVIMPFLAAFLTALLGRRFKSFGDIAASISGLCLFIFSLYFFKLSAASNKLVCMIGGWSPPAGICLVLDGFSGLMLVIINLVSLLAMVYSIRYMARYTDKWKYHVLFMIMLGGMNGVILSGDLFNMYVMLEAASISAYALVAFGVEPEGLEASFKYAVMGALASIFILLGVVLIYSYASTLNMADVSAALSGGQSRHLIGFVSVLFLAGFGLKAAIVPFHAWLPDAHSSAPSPVSAVLSGVFIKTLGIYALCRIFLNVMDISGGILFALMILGVLSMAVGAFLAIAQNDIKRMFAYSSISQIGYIVFALGIGTPLAVLGALFHLFNHAFLKSLLFFNAGAIEYATGERTLDRLGGLNKKLPVTGWTSLVGSMGISGIPPLAGFWSKLIIIIAAVQARHFVFAAIAVLVSIITLAYYMKFQSSAFFGKLNEAWVNVKQTPLSMKLPMLILALICIAGGLMLIGPFRPFLDAAVYVLLPVKT